MMSSQEKNRTCSINRRYTWMASRPCYNLYIFLLTLVYLELGLLQLNRDCFSRAKLQTVLPQKHSTAVNRFIAAKFLPCSALYGGSPECGSTEDDTVVGVLTKPYDKSNKQDCNRTEQQSQSVNQADKRQVYRRRHKKRPCFTPNFIMIKNELSTALGKKQVTDEQTDRTSSFREATALVRRNSKIECRKSNLKPEFQTAEDRTQSHDAYTAASVQHPL